MYTIVACLRLKWLLNLCTEYMNLEEIHEKFDHYLVRYIVAVLYNMLTNKDEKWCLSKEVSNLCGTHFVQELMEIGIQLFQAKYNIIVNEYLLRFLRNLCFCISMVSNTLC